MKREGAPEMDDDGAENEEDDETDEEDAEGEEKQIALSVRKTGKEVGSESRE